MKLTVIMLFLHVIRSSVHAFRLPVSAGQAFRSVLRQQVCPARSLAFRSLATLPSVLSTVESLNFDSSANSNPEELPTLSKRAKRGKVRQHVNPLSRGHSRPLELDTNWMDTAFERIGPGEFIVDIGCAKGVWAMVMCKVNPDINIVGLEIRIPIVEFCVARKEEEGVRNVHYLKSNANVDLNNIFASLSTKNIDVNTVTIQFPDPHFKAKHKKRRVVNADLVRTIARNLKPGARVFVQTDIEELGYDMVSYFAASEYFTAAEGYNVEALHTNSAIYEVQTEREICTLREDKPVYRMLFFRNHVP